MNYELKLSEFIFSAGNVFFSIQTLDKDYNLLELSASEDKSELEKKMDLAEDYLLLFVISFVKNLRIMFNKLKTKNTVDNETLSEYESYTLSDVSEKKSSSTSNFIIQSMSKNIFLNSINNLAEISTVIYELLSILLSDTKEKLNKFMYTTENG